MNKSTALLLAYRITERGVATAGGVVRYSLTPPSPADSRRVEQVEEIRVRLEPGVRVGRSAAGEQLLYNPPHVYGKRLSEALRLGWCELLEPESV